MPDDELTSRFDGLRERLAPLVEEPPVGAIERRGRRRQRARRAGAALAVAAVAVGAWMLVTATGRGWPGGDLDQGPVAPAPTVPAPAPPPTTAPEPTRTSREPAAEPAPSSSLRAGPDGSFTSEFEIPPGPTGDFFLDATCGGATREVKLRREP
jgi:hypothetical protein